MRIVILDGYTLNPGDLSWDELKLCGDLSVYDSTPRDKILERAHGAQALITNKTPLRADTLAALPDMRCICVLATGYDVVDVAAARARNIPVCNTPAYGVDSVAQHVFALLLELCRGVGRHDASVRDGDWERREGFCYWLAPQVELTGKIMGIVGFGNNGRRVGELAHAFGMEVLAYVPRTGAVAPGYAPFAFVELDELFAKAHVISLHCPLNDATRTMVDERRLASMQKGALLINTGRGPLLDETAVAQALHSGQLGGLGTDVLSVEPPRMDNPLLKSPNTYITPHIAWASVQARRNIISITAANLRAFVAGRPQNVVNP
ncbi:MAG: D-2-hydroxyacid dehydrogenase [Betaproteobacteria bacterium]|nr:D-2-hydroxyacid dehydrogenase [Betaproteobacteria bacterium]